MMMMMMIDEQESKKKCRDKVEEVEWKKVDAKLSSILK